MKWRSFTLMLLSLAAGYYSGASPARKQSRKPPCLIENEGQVVSQSGTPRADIDFKIQAGGGLNIFLGNSQLHYQWNRHDKDSAIQMYRMDVTLVGANLNPQIIRQEPVGYYERYYLPSTAGKGVLAKSFGKVTYKDIYPGIDWVLYFNQAGQLEYDFVVHPTGRVSDIRLRYEGATSLKVDPQGKLVANTPYGSVTEHVPYAYQQTDGLVVASKFELRNNELSFAINRYEGTLVIDPTIEWATYYGGETRDYGMAVATDTGGHVILVGNTESTENIATTGSFQTTYGGGTGELGYPSDAFLASYDRSGDLLWSTYVGGDNDESFNAVTTDSSGDIIVCGWTRSVDAISTDGSHQETHGGSDDACLMKFSREGERIWGTYYGGSGDENGPVIGSLYCDPGGNIYMAGTTTSEDNVSSFDASGFNGVGDGFLAKFSSEGERLWGRYLGSDDYTTGYSLSGIGDSVLYVGGLTMSSTGISTSGTFQESIGGSIDGFIRKYDSDGTLLAGTYFGGSGVDGTCGLACSAGYVYMTGVTYSSEGIASEGSYQDTLGGSQDIVLAQFNHDLTRNWSTYLGGTLSDGVATSATLAFDPLGNIYLAGNTSSSESLATVDAFQTELSGEFDALIAKFDTEGDLLYATYYGGTGDEYPNGIAASVEGMIFIAGQTASGSGVASADGWQTELAGGHDGFLLAINDCIIPDTPGAISGPELVCAGEEQTYSLEAVDGAVSYSWTLPEGWTGDSDGTSITVTTGDVGGEIIVIANGMCSSSGPQVLSVEVSPKPTLIPSGDTAICDGASIVLSATATGETTSFSWQQDGEIISDASESSLIVSNAGTFRVITDNGTCQDTSASIIIGINPLPEPLIVNSEGVLSTTETYSSYQWNFNGSPISGADESTFVTSIGGDYSVTVTDANGCEGTSGQVTGLPETDLTRMVGVYPNPTNDHFTISTPTDGELSITASDGRTLGMPIRVSRGVSRVDTSFLSDGIYLITFRCAKGGSTSNYKLIKSH